MVAIEGIRTLWRVIQIVIQRYNSERFMYNALDMPVARMQGGRQ